MKAYKAFMLEQEVDGKPYRTLVLAPASLDSDDMAKFSAEGDRYANQNTKGIVGVTTEVEYLVEFDGYVDTLTGHVQP